MALAVGMVLVLLGVEWLNRLKAAELYALNDELQSRLESVREELRSVTADAGHVLVQIERAKALKSKRAWSGMLAMVSQCMAPGSWLTSIATDPPKPPGGKARSRGTDGKKEEGGQTQRLVTIEAPRKLRIAGYAPAAAHPYDIVTSLKATDAFASVALERSVREPVLDGSYFRFELVFIFEFLVFLWGQNLPYA